METGLYYMRLVAGTGHVEELVTGRVNLPVPAEEILEWRKCIQLDRAEALCGGVVITGVVRSRCVFAAPDGAGPSRVLSHVTEIWFRLHLPLPEADAGMLVTVTDAFVASDASRPIAWSRAGDITALLDRSLVVVGVRLVRPEFVPQGPVKPKRPRNTPKPPRRRKRPAKGPAAEPPAPAPPPPPEKRSTGTWVHPAAAVPGVSMATETKQDTARS